MIKSKLVLLSDGILVAFHVHEEGVADGELLPTILALVRLFSCVRTNVGLQSSLSGSPGVTQMTSKGLLTRVDHVVATKVAGLGEFARAELALKGFFTGVNSLVSLEVGGLTEFLVALVALELARASALLQGLARGADPESIDLFSVWVWRSGQE